jgi:mRNA-degrading endonuclease toxin of MazEF toxin-antitoxin module
MDDTQLSASAPSSRSPSSAGNTLAGTGTAARSFGDGARLIPKNPGRDEAIGRLNEVIVVPLTAVVRGLSNEVELDVADGLPRACVTGFDNLSMIARGQLVEKIATLAPARMDEICRALNATVACRAGTTRAACRDSNFDGKALDMTRTARTTLSILRTNKGGRLCFEGNRLGGNSPTAIPSMELRDPGKISLHAGTLRCFLGKHVTPLCRRAADGCPLG